MSSAASRQPSAGFVKTGQPVGRFDHLEAIDNSLTSHVAILSVTNTRLAPAFDPPGHSGTGTPNQPQVLFAFALDSMPALVCLLSKCSSHSISGFSFEATFFPGLSYQSF